MPKPKQVSRVTMQDVARLAGVGTMTVSRALRSPEKVAAGTRKKIQKVIESTGFVADANAGGLKSGKSRLIAAVFPTFGTSASIETIEGIRSVFGPAGYEILMGDTHYEMKEEERIVLGALRWRPAGIILAGLTHSAKTLQAIKNAQVPLAEVWSVTDDPRDIVVGFSHRDASYTMARSLVEWGYKKIAYVHISTVDNERARTRRDGYLMAMQASGIVPEPGMYLEVPLTYKAGAEALVTLRSRFPNLDAIFFGSDQLAVGALLECQRRGIKVPDDIAIAGFDDLDLSSQIIPALTTIKTRLFEVGRRAAELLIGRMEGRINTPIVESWPQEIIRRESA